MEIRIGHACKLLIEDKLTVSKICTESGFNNFSNFNRYFKLITKQCPLEYRKTFAKK
jgi:transcriptional regulator GlxA family with amidase domain